MYQIFENGRELTLNIFKPGTYFPMIWAFSGQTNRYYFEAFSSAKVFIAPKDSVIKLLRSDPEILFDLTSRLVTGFGKLLSNVEQLLCANASQRITCTLVILANRFGKAVSDNRILITLSLSHEDIANLSNLTRETTSIEMKKLMDQKLITYTRRKIFIESLEKLNLHID
jgi:CRP-like cAMP-binding protein